MKSKKFIAIFMLFIMFITTLFMDVKKAQATAIPYTIGISELVMELLVSLGLAGNSVSNRKDAIKTNSEYVQEVELTGKGFLGSSGITIKYADDTIDYEIDNEVVRVKNNGYVLNPQLIKEYFTDTKDRFINSANALKGMGLNTLKDLTTAIKKAYNSSSTQLEKDISASARQALNNLGGIVPIRAWQDILIGNYKLSWYMSNWPGQMTYYYNNGLNYYLLLRQNRNVVLLLSNSPFFANYNSSGKKIEVATNGEIKGYQYKTIDSKWEEIFNYDLVMLFIDAGYSAVPLLSNGYSFPWQMWSTGWLNEYSIINNVVGFDPVVTVFENVYTGAMVVEHDGLQNLINVLDDAETIDIANGDEPYVDNSKTKSLITDIVGEKNPSLVYPVTDSVELPVIADGVTGILGWLQKIWNLLSSFWDLVKSIPLAIFERFEWVLNGILDVVKSIDLTGVIDAIKDIDLTIDLPNIMDIPGIIVDGITDVITGVFVPSEYVIEKFFNDTMVRVESATGMLSYPFALLVRFLNFVGNIDTGDCIITFPQIRFMRITLSEEYTFNLSEYVRKPHIKPMYEVYLTITNFILIMYVCHLAHNKYNKMMGGGYY